MRKQGGAEVFRITGARAGLTEDVRGRQRRYVISMSIRTVSVILTVVLWNVERPLAWVMLVLGALLPYVAVVYANAGRENGPERPVAAVPPPVRPALEPSSVEPGSRAASGQRVPPSAEDAGDGEHGAATGADGAADSRAAAAEPGETR
jgi:hypothetical protein